MYLIYNTVRKQYWKQNCHGYVTDRNQAGVFSKRDAESVCSRPNSKNVMEKVK